MHAFAPGTRSTDLPCRALQRALTDAKPCPPTGSVTTRSPKPAISGLPKALRRMDGAVLASIDIAIRKATTAVLFQANSEAVWEYCKPGAPAQGLQLTNGGLAPFGGGIPLKTVDGECVGAVGVSGGAVAQ